MNLNKEYKHKNRDTTKSNPCQIKYGNVIVRN